MDGQVDGCVEEWMGGRTNGSICRRLSHPFFIQLLHSEGFPRASCFTREVCAGPELYLGWVELCLGVDFRALKGRNHTFLSMCFSNHFILCHIVDAE